MIIGMLRLLLFLISIYGYQMFLKKKWNIEMECSLIILFSSISCILFLAGILNIMNIAFWGIFGGGLILSGIFLIKRHLKIGFSFAFFFYVVAIGTLFVILYYEKYFHYDNFSHWGLIVKNIYRNCRFPNFQDTMIHFQAYPTGSACFIWYVCRIVGYSEGNTLFAQAILTLSCMMPFFVLIREVPWRNKLLLTMFIVVESVIWIIYGAARGIGLYQLLVDVLLAAVATAAFTISYYYKNHIIKAVLCVTPLLVFDVCIKNSGIIWVFAILTELLFFCFVNKTELRKSLKIIGIILGASFVFRILWDRHIQMVFDNASTSKHAMSLAYWTKSFRAKSPEDLHTITQRFIERAFSLKDNKVAVLLLVSVIFTAILLKFYKRTVAKVHILFGCIFILGVTIIYQVGNYLMYIFSMPGPEALRLAEYNRYVITLECFILGVFSVFLLDIVQLLDQEKKINCWCSRFAVVLILVGLLISESADIKYLVRQKDLQSSLNNNIFASWRADRIRLDKLVDSYHIAEGKKSLLYVGDQNVNFRADMARYVLYSENIKAIHSDQVSQLKNANQYDYVIIMEHDDIVDSWLADTSIPFEENECLRTEDYQYIPLQKYLQALNKEQYIIFMSVKDEASRAYTKEMADSFKSLGLRENLMDGFRYSYGAVIDGDIVVYEHLGEEQIKISGECSGVKYDLISAGLRSGNQSSIILDGQEYSQNLRGINIVVYDKEIQKVIDSICFDTWQLDGTYRERSDQNLIVSQF